MSSRVRELHLRADHLGGLWRRLSVSGRGYRAQETLEDRTVYSFSRPEQE